MTNKITPSVLLLLSVIMSFGAAAGCDLTQITEQRKAGMTSLGQIDVVEMIKETQIPRDSWVRRLKLTSHLFFSSVRDKPDSECVHGRGRDNEVPRGQPFSMVFGWLLKLPEDALSDIFVLDNQLTAIEKHDDSRFSLSGRLLLDWQKGREIRAVASLDFLSENLDIFYSRKEGRVPRIAVSGPYWETTEGGEGIRGFHKPSIGGPISEQGYADFFAGHVLCIKEGALRAISPKEIDSFETRRNYVHEAAKECDSAIQVGPSFLDGSWQGIVVQSGRSPLERITRNILFRTLSKNGAEKTFLWSVEQPISWIDANLIITEIASSVGSGSVLQWALGLVDGKDMSGPYFFEGNRVVVEIGEGDRKFGAVLLLYDLSE